MQKLKKKVMQDNKYENLNNESFKKMQIKVHLLSFK